MLIAIFLGISLSMDSKVLRSILNTVIMLATRQFVPRTYHGVLLRTLSNIIHVSKYIRDISLAHLFI